MADSNNKVNAASFEKVDEACDELARIVEKRISEFGGLVGPQHIHVFIDQKDGKFYVKDLSFNPESADNESSDS